ERPTRSQGRVVLHLDPGGSRKTTTPTGFQNDPTRATSVDAQAPRAHRRSLRCSCALARRLATSLPRCSLWASGSRSPPRPAPALLMPTPLTNFDGVGAGFSGPQGTFSVTSAPPDTNGDVGPNHYIQTVNTSFAIFNKSGTVLYGPVGINTLWQSMSNGCKTN